MSTGPNGDGTGKKRYKLSAEDEAQLKEAFGVFDTSGDGQIDAKELHTILAAVLQKDLSMDEVQLMIAAVDEGGDGEIQLPEFLQLMADQMQGQKQDEELIAAFKYFGADSEKEVITFERLQAVLHKDDEGFAPGELKIIFDEIAGASRKPTLRGAAAARNSRLGDELEDD